MFRHDIDGDSTFPFPSVIPSLLRKPILYWPDAELCLGPRPFGQLSSNFSVAMRRSKLSDFLRTF